MRRTDFYGFYGQRDVVKFINRIAEGAMANGEPFPDSLLLGGSGLGKTHLAQAIGRKLGTTTHVICCSRAFTIPALAEQAMTWEERDVVLLDEVHSLEHDVRERVYRIMVEGMAPNVEVGPNGGTKVVGEVPIPAVTVIGATDRPGHLMNAFRKRFAHEIVLTPYPVREMVEIVRRRAERVGVRLTAQAAKLLAEASRGVPRVAGHLLGLFRCYYAIAPARLEPTHGVRLLAEATQGAPSAAGQAPDLLQRGGADNQVMLELTAGHVRAFLDAKGIDELGRNDIDRRYMDVLAKHEPRSLKTLALALQLDSDYLKTEVEPWLVQQGFLDITPAGRCLMPEGRALQQPKVMEIAARPRPTRPALYAVPA